MRARPRTLIVNHPYFHPKRAPRASRRLSRTTTSTHNILLPKAYHALSLFGPPFSHVDVTIASAVECCSIERMSDAKLARWMQGGPQLVLEPQPSIDHLPSRAGPAKPPADRVRSGQSSRHLLVDVTPTTCWTSRATWRSSRKRAEQRARPHATPPAR